MTKSIWMNAWDLAGQEPEAAAAELANAGLNACSLGFSYHGGRMVLPRNAHHVVYEQDRSAAYFPVSEEKYQSLKLKPNVAPEAERVMPFLKACDAAGIAASAWTVLCHNDRLGEKHPDCCVQNVFGDRYTYALCPSGPAVQRYVTTLCADIAATPHVSKLELEALSFMGYRHGSLHDKHGVPLPEWVQWLLSICVCPHCRDRLDADTEALAQHAQSSIREYFERFQYREEPPELRACLEKVLGAKLLENLLEARRKVIRDLLSKIKEAVGAFHVDLRVALSPLFVGGKSALGWEDMDGRADSATVTFFGSTVEEMAQEAQRIPSPEERPLPVNGGFIFHASDCTSASDVQARVDLLRKAEVDGLSFYCLSMATNTHLRWLSEAL